MSSKRSFVEGIAEGLAIEVAFSKEHGGSDADGVVFVPIGRLSKTTGDLMGTEPNSHAGAAIDVLGGMAGLSVVLCSTGYKVLGVNVSASGIVDVKQSVMDWFTKWFNAAAVDIKQSAVAAASRKIRKEREHRSLRLCDWKRIVALDLRSSEVGRVIDAGRVGGVREKDAVLKISTLFNVSKAAAAKIVEAGGITASLLDSARSSITVEENMCKPPPVSLDPVSTVSVTVESDVGFEDAASAVARAAAAQPFTLDSIATALTGISKQISILKGETDSLREVMMRIDVKVDSLGSQFWKGVGNIVKAAGVVPHNRNKEDNEQGV